MLDEADVITVQRLIGEGLATWDRTRRELVRLESDKREAADPPVTKLYLISLGGNHIAFPDERGRAVFTQAIYARVAMRNGDARYFNGAGKAEVVAYGDGQLLEKPATVILTGLSIVGLVEVPEDLLKSKTA